MFLYLPVALTSINSLLTIGVGFIVGILTGVFGVGGGWLITPLLMMMGISPTISVATGANQMMASATSGAYATTDSVMWTSRWGGACSEEVSLEDL